MCNGRRRGTRVPYARLWRFPSGSREHASTRWYLHCRYCWNLSRPDHLLSAVARMYTEQRVDDGKPATVLEPSTIDGSARRRRPCRPRAPRPGRSRRDVRRQRQRPARSGCRSARRGAGRSRRARRSRSRPRRAARRRASSDPRARTARRRSCRRRSRAAASTWTMRTVPGGSSSSGQTSISATQATRRAVISPLERAPLLRQRRSLRLVQRDLEDAEPEQRALEPHRRQRDPDLLEQLVLRHRRDLLGGPSLDEVGQHRRRRLADRAAAPLEADASITSPVAEPHGDGHLVAAERVLALGDGVARVEQAVVARASCSGRG